MSSENHTNYELPNPDGIEKKDDQTMLINTKDTGPHKRFKASSLESSNEKFENVRRSSGQVNTDNGV